MRCETHKLVMYLCQGTCRASVFFFVTIVHPSYTKCSAHAYMAALRPSAVVSTITTSTLPPSPSG